MIKAKGILFFVLVMFCIAFTDVDVRTKKAREVLEKMNNRINACSTFKAVMNVQLIDADGRTENYSMLIYLKDKKYRLEHKDVINIFDGEYEYTNVFPGTEDDEIIRMPDSFIKIDRNLWSVLDYEKGFKYVYLEKENKGGNTGHFVSLFPLQPDKKKYHTVKLEVSRTTNLPSSMKMLMKNGNSLNCMITELKINIALEDSLFNIHEK